METKIVPLILAGGKGSRLWPLSRESFPKQFICFDGENSLLQNTLKRAQKISNGTQSYIIAGADQYALVVSSLHEKEGVDYRFVGEPFSRNTAAAIYYGCQYMEHLEEETMIVVMPSDHDIGDEDGFLRDVQNAVSLAMRKDQLVLFGVSPDEPLPCFGYVEVGESLFYEGFSYCQVRKFKEKPNREQAEEYLKNGRYYWNSGIIVCSLGRLKKLYEKHFPIAEKLYSDYEGIENISFDRAVLEKEDNFFLIKASFDWNDMGSFSRIASQFPQDRQQNQKKGNVLLKDVNDSIVISDNLLTVVMGMDNLVVVENQGVLLICPKNCVEKIGEIGMMLNDKNRIFR